MLLFKKYQKWGPSKLCLKPFLGIGLQYFKHIISELKNNCAFYKCLHLKAPYQLCPIYHPVIDVTLVDIFDPSLFCRGLTSKCFEDLNN